MNGDTRDRQQTVAGRCDRCGQTADRPTDGAAAGGTSPPGDTPRRVGVSRPRPESVSEYRGVPPEVPNEHTRTPPGQSGRPAQSGGDTPAPLGGETPAPLGGETPAPLGAVGRGHTGSTGHSRAGRHRLHWAQSGGETPAPLGGETQAPLGAVGRGDTGSTGHSRAGRHQLHWAQSGGETLAPLGAPSGPAKRRLSWDSSRGLMRALSPNAKIGASRCCCCMLYTKKSQCERSALNSAIQGKAGIRGVVLPPLKHAASIWLVAEQWIYNSYQVCHIPTGVRAESTSGHSLVFYSCTTTVTISSASGMT